MQDTPKKKEAAIGAPAYMTTFADLMALLMCFFVLLLSFSEMDLQKFKQVSGSMAQAFGVQREIFAKESPMGTSYVAREFSPGKAEPTPFKVMQQKSSQVHPYLDRDQKEQRRREEIAKRMRDKLAEEIRRGLLEIHTEQDRIVIRIREKGSFDSGSADLQDQFKPVVASIGQILQDTPGQIVVAGHTDNVPIRTGRFRSNWELSSSRAVTVAHALLQSTQLAPTRFLIEGHGDVNPIAANDNNEHRALNRRVEITLKQAPDSAAADSKLKTDVQSDQSATLPILTSKS